MEVSPNDNLLTSGNYFYVNPEIEYRLYFESLASSPVPFAFTIVECYVDDLDDFSDYLMRIEHLTSAPYYRYYIEAHNLSHVASTSTSGFYTSASSSCSYDSVSNPFGITSGENRKAISDTTFGWFSAVAREETIYYSQFHPYAPNEVLGRGSATFVGDDIVLTCSHNIIPAVGQDVCHYAIARSVRFLPGHDNTASVINPYGVYRATESYLPLGRLLLRFPIDQIGDSASTKAAKESQRSQSLIFSFGYDWAICKTTKTISGIYGTHSYMGLGNFGNLTSSSVSVTGYPVRSDNNASEERMWTYENHGESSVYRPHYLINGSPDTSLFQDAFYGNMLITGEVSPYAGPNNPISDDELDAGTPINAFTHTNEAIITKGQSGGPAYIRTTSVVNGQIYHSAQIIGVTVGNRYTTTETSTHYYYGYVSRSNHYMVNLLCMVMEDS